jgi:APA family basic amino acid/polyamine antiporter
MGRVNKARGSPDSAIFLQVAVAVFIVFTTSLDLLLLYIGFTLSLCSTATVAGLILLRL